MSRAELAQRGSRLDSEIHSPTNARAMALTMALSTCRLTGAADLALIPVIDSEEKPSWEANDEIKALIGFIKESLDEAVADVRPSDRLTDSAVCIVASELCPDRQLEKLLAGAGRLKFAARPILEVNPRHKIIVALAALGDDDLAFKHDAAHLLFDEARVLDGDRPANARLFCDRLARVLTRSIGKPAG